MRFVAIGSLNKNVYVADLRTMVIAPPLQGHTDTVARVDVKGIVWCRLGWLGVWACSSFRFSYLVV